MDDACDRLRSPHGPRVTVFAFDLLALEGEDLRGRPQRDRKALLVGVLLRGDQVLQGVHAIESEPAALVESVRKLGLEGVVAKWSGSR